MTFELSEEELEASGDESPKQAEKQANACYYCNKAGHLPINCPKKPKTATANRSPSPDVQIVGDRAPNRDGGRNRGGDFDGGRRNGGDVKSNTCWAFKSGRCNYGDRCRFTHEGAESGALARDEWEPRREAPQRREPPRTAGRERRKSTRSPSLSFSDSEGQDERDKTLLYKMKILKLEIRIRTLEGRLAKRDKEIASLKRSAGAR